MTSLQWQGHTVDSRYTRRPRIILFNSSLPSILNLYLNQLDLVYDPNTKAIIMSTPTSVASDSSSRVSKRQSKQS